MYLSTTRGGVVAAPMVGEIFEQILPILGVKKDYKNQIEKELRWYIDTPYHNVPNFINMNKSKIKTSSYYNYLYILEMVIQLLIKNQLMAKEYKKVELSFYI